MCVAAPENTTQMGILDMHSDAVGHDEFAEWAAVFAKDHRFAWAYKEEHPQAVVRVGAVDGSIHCYVYDLDRNAVLDATLDRFDGLRAGCWDGRDHPHVDDGPEEAYDDYGAFIDQYAGPDSPFEF